jgi:hypothetical protein
MPIWLLAVPGRVWGWLAGAGAIAGAVLMGLAKAKTAGVAQQVAVQAAEDREAARVRIEEDARAARAADPVGQLRSRWSR